MELRLIALLPRILSEGRDGLTEGTRCSRGCAPSTASCMMPPNPWLSRMRKLVQNALQEDPLAVSAWRRLSGRYPRCATRAGIAALRARLHDKHSNPALGQGRGPCSCVARPCWSGCGGNMRTKALIEVWLFRACALDDRTLRRADSAYRQRLLLLVSAVTFRIRQISDTADGRQIVRVTENPAAVVSIGRASDCDIYLPDLAVEPLQAIAEMKQDGRPVGQRCGHAGLRGRRQEGSGDRCRPGQRRGTGVRQPSRDRGRPMSMG